MKKTTLEMPNKKTLADNSIKVFPAKKFFVESLTRDIDLADAILDLLDNCVDGARRKGIKNGEKPYAGFRASIVFDENQFIIEDNCGGITLKDARESAFCFGRPENYAVKTDGTIGIIGIGMKRAIFKIGRSCVVRSQHRNDTFQVKIDPEWLQSENWNLYYKFVNREPIENGTRITINLLNDSVKEEFGSHLFEKRLWEKVMGAFSLLIDRGFEVKINKQTVSSHVPTLLWQDSSSKDEPVMRPYVYKDIIDGVNVYIAVGFRQWDKQLDHDEDTKKYYSTEPAGWTIACNDRVVLFCDKSEQTGWGTGGVPEYHTQFIRISGFAEFSAQDPTKLPFTTTKHGINHQSKVFLRVFEKLREGTKMFTDWTNRFKDFSPQREAAFAHAQSLSVELIKERVEEMQTAKQKRTAIPEAFTLRPKLPSPNAGKKERIVSFRKLEADIQLVSDYLFGNKNESATRVGETCFDSIFQKAKK